jgi:hypothetical protein
VFEKLKPKKKEEQKSGGGIYQPNMRDGAFINNPFSQPSR